jgi:hypothetical protein
MISSSVEVITEATSHDLISLDEVKAFFNITTTTDDARMQSLITFNSLIIADICDRVFGLEEVEETLYDEQWNGLPGVGICLDRYPVMEVESVTVGGSAVDYIVEPKSGILRIRNGGTFSNDVVVRYKGGYNCPDDAPKGLAQAAVEGIRGSFYYGSRDPMIQAIMDNNSGSIRFFPPPGVSRTGGGSGGGTARPLTPTATALLIPYMRRAMA